MPTIAEVQLLNNALDDLTKTLLQKRLLKDKREQEIADRLLRQKLHDELLKARKEEQTTDITARATEAGEQRKFTRGENEADRSSRERLNEADIAAANTRTDKTLAAHEKLQKIADQQRLVEQFITDNNKGQLSTEQRTEANRWFQANGIGFQLTEPPGPEIKNAQAGGGEFPFYRDAHGWAPLQKPANPRQATEVVKTGGDAPGEPERVITRPLTDQEAAAAASTPPKTATKDPAKTKLAAIEEQIREQEIEQALGDEHTGLLNWKSRGAVIKDLQGQRASIQKLLGTDLDQGRQPSLVRSNAAPAQINDTPATIKAITPEIAEDLLRKAGGDKSKARALAKALGYAF